ncbi:MAG: aminotransferase class I/II-fold pyridoxal phosphate-dependent enzyme [Methanobacterium sp.]
MFSYSIWYCNFANLFGFTALEAAYRYGDEWLKQVLDYLQGNLDFLMDYFKNKIDGITVIQPQGTYLIWLDCRELGLNNQALKRLMEQKARVGMEDGFIFGEVGSGFMRMNIACPRPLLEEALKRIEYALNKIR